MTGLGFWAQKKSTAAGVGPLRRLFVKQMILVKICSSKGGNSKRLTVYS